MSASDELLIVLAMLGLVIAWGAVLYLRHLHR